MTSLIIFLAVVNLVAGEWSARGRRLAMSSHPLVVRLRRFALGAVAALFGAGYQFADDDWGSWGLAIALAVSVARFPFPSRSASPAEARRLAAPPRGGLTPRHTAN